MASPQCILSFGLITYLSAKGLHTSLRDDYTASVTAYIQGFALIFSVYSLNAVGGYFNSLRISSALVSGLTFGIIFSMLPFSSIMKVVRTTPKLTLP